MADAQVASEEVAELRRGLVTDVVDGFALVALGPQGEPWEFPLTILPPGVEAGTELEVVFRSGRPDVDQPIAASSQPDAEVGRRLDRLQRLERLTGHVVGG